MTIFASIKNFFADPPPPVKTEDDTFDALRRIPRDQLEKMHATECMIIQHNAGWDFV